MKTAVPALIIALLSGCSSTPDPRQADSGAWSCTREVTTGSTIASTRCRTPEQLEQERRAAEATATEIRRNPGSSGAVKP